jgi:hypothetical protein
VIYPTATGWHCKCTRVWTYTWRLAAVHWQFEVKHWLLFTTEMICHQSLLLSPFKHFVKATTQNRKCFCYLLQYFPWISSKQTKDNVFCLSWHRGNLLRSYTELKSELEAFKLHCKIQIGCGRFLGNYKTLSRRWLKEQMLQTYRVMGCKYSSFHLTLIYFQETLEKSIMNIVKGSDKVFLHTMERRYQRKYNLTLLADCFWFLKTEIPYMYKTTLCQKKIYIH